MLPVMASTRLSWRHVLRGGRVILIRMIRMLDFGGFLLLALIMQVVDLHDYPSGKGLRNDLTRW
jgi:hypothetical protein